MAKVSRESIIPALIAVAVGALLGYALDNINKPFAQIEVTGEQTGNIHRALVTVANQGFVPATDLEITMLSSSPILDYQLQTIGQDVEFDTSDPNRLKARMSRLIQDYKVVIEVTFLTSSSNFLLVDASHQQGASYGYFELGDTIKEVRSSGSNSPKTILFVTTPFMILMSVFAYWTASKGSSLSIRSDLIFGRENIRSRRFVAYVRQDIQTIRGALEADKVSTGSLGFYVWYFWSPKKKHNLFPPIDYEMLDDFFTKLKMRDFDLKAEKLDSFRLVKINEECAAIASRLNNTIDWTRYPSIRIPKTKRFR